MENEVTSDGATLIDGSEVGDRATGAVSQTTSIKETFMKCPHCEASFDAKCNEKITLGSLDRYIVFYCGVCTKVLAVAPDISYLVDQIKDTD